MDYANQFVKSGTTSALITCTVIYHTLTTVVMAAKDYTKLLKTPLSFVRKWVLMWVLIVAVGMVFQPALKRNCR